MKFKAIAIAALIFLAMIALGAVSAGENVTYDAGDVLETADDSSIEVEASADEEALGEEEHTFSEFDDELGGYGSEYPVILDKDYSYDDGFDTGGIYLGDNWTIEGNGHTIDGKSKSRIFEIGADNVVLNNITFANGNSSAIYINASNVIISNCRFVNCSNADYGGAIRIVGEHATILNCSLFNCTAKIQGGAICSETISLDIVDCYFEHNYAGLGGAIALYDNNNVVNCSFVDNSAASAAAIFVNGVGCSVVNCSFANSNVSECGGAVQIYCGSGDFLNCSFVNSTAGMDGGAVHAGDYGSGNFVNCSFLNSYSAKGGAISIDDVDYAMIVVVDGCSFVNSTASDDEGGAIRFGTMINGVVTNCNFNNCWVTGDCGNGAAIFFDTDGYCNVMNCNFTNNTGGPVWSNGDGNVSNCIFYDNHGADIRLSSGMVTNCSFNNSGGVLYDYSGDVINCRFANMDQGAIQMFSGDVINCSFTNIEGGAIQFGADSTGRVINCNFTNNTAGSDGGAIYFYDGSTGSVINCNFVNNSASEWGGAIYMHSGNVTNCNFVNNSADNCGAVCIEENGTVTDCNFTNNKATVPLYSYGGAIFFGWYSVGSVINCNFVNNTAYIDGGAVYFDRYSVGSVMDCNFVNNSAGDGGAVFFDPESIGTVTNCNFTDNSANNDGGAIYFGNGGNVTDCNFTNNEATNGGAIFSYGVSEVRSSRFSYNRAVLGGAIYKCDYEDCVFVSNSEPQVYLDPEMRKNATITIDVSDIHAMQEQYGLINLSGGISANVTAILNEISSSVEVINGTGILNLSGLAAGTYNLTVVFNGTSEYNATSANVIFSVSKSDSTVIIDVNDTYFGDDVSIVVTVPVTATGSVVIRVNGNDYNLSLTDGRVSLSVSNLEIGNYTVQVSYGGDANYDSRVNTTSFRVMQNTFTRLQEFINGASDSLTLDRDYYGDGTTITISKAITIDGAGHVLDARKLSSIFTVSSNYVVITNITLKNANSTGGGAIHIDSDSDLAVFDCRFINNSAQNGGDIYVSGDSHCDVGNCVFINSTAVQNGGVIFVESNASSIIGSSDFINSHAGKHGGALFVSLMGAGSVDTSYFFNSTAGQYGGAFYFSSETVSSATDCNLTNCSAVRGGAIYVEANNEYDAPLMDTCIFENCRATDGGAIFSEGNVEFRSSNFTNDIASNGCAVYIAASGSLLVKETSFNYCAAQASGGALYILGSADIRDSSFDSNFAKNSAGVAYIGLSGSANFENCSFINSTAGQDGAFYIAGSANIVNCSFVNSKSFFMFLGGGDISIYSNGSANIVNSTFTGSTSSANGGAIYIDNGRANVTGCSFTDCASSDGGAIYSQGELEVRGCTFSNNKAYGNGGAIYSSGEATAISSTFSDNTADALGGAIYNCYYTDCTFESNTEPQIYFDEEYRKIVNMTVEVPAESMVGDNITAFIVLSQSLSVNVTVTVNGTNWTVGLLNGNGTLQIPALPVGTYNLTVTFPGTEEYKSASANVAFSVLSFNSTVVINVNDTYFGDDVTIVVIVPNDAKGNVSLTIGGDVYHVTIEDGMGSITLPGPEIGTYLVTANYPGDDKYNPSEVSTSFKVMQNTFSRLQELINAASDSITLDRNYYGDGTPVTISKSIAIDGNGYTLNANGLSGIFTVTSGNVVIRNLNFVNGSATGNGGAICFGSGSTGSVANCNFTNNTASDIGGAIYFAEEGSVTDCTFANNSAVYGGGGAVIFNGEGNVTGSNFADNYAGDGGAVSFYYSEGYVAYCNFTNNRAVGSFGGAVCFYNKGTLRSCNFVNNTASDNGGAVYFEDYSTATDCNFTDNRAEDYGGAVSMNSGIITGCNFTDNRADVHGGAIKMSSGTVTNCNFNDNCAEGKGGAIFSNSVGEAINSTFTNNSAELGGAIYNCNYANCIFTLNTEPAIYFDEEHRKVVNMTVEVPAVSMVGDNITVSIALSESLSADVFVTVGDMVCVVGLMNGTGALMIPALPAGTYNLSVTFNGTYEYRNCTESVSFSVLKFNSTVVVNVSDTYFGDNVTVGVSVANDATGNITIMVYWTDLLVHVEVYDNLTILGIEVPDLEIGEYTVRVMYGGDDKYNPAETSKSFEVMQNTFTCLQELIDDASDSLTLDRDYYGDGSEIGIFKTITIDGNGHVLDAKGRSGIFYISALNVTIKNLAFANGNSSSMGGAIQIGNHSEVTIENCSFINSTAAYAGGAIYSEYGVEVWNCSFVNSTSAYGGGAIAVEGTSIIMNCSFAESSSEEGGAIAMAKLGIVEDCSFSDCSAKKGGAIYFDESGVVVNSVFINCAATDGGAIFSNEIADVISSTFSYNVADLGGAIYNCNYDNCTFSGNSEPAIYFDEEYRKDVNMTVYAPNIMVGEELTVVVNISCNINSSVTVMVNNLLMPISVVNGTGTLHVANLSAGNYPILAIFNGTYEYNESIASSSFTVSKYDSFVNITKTDLDSNVILDNKFVYGTEFLIEVTNNTAPVIVTINGAEYPVSEGKVVVNTAELSAGNYTVIARIPESGMFHASEQNMTFTITTKDVAITIGTVNIFVDQNEIVTVIFNDNITCSVFVQISQEVKSGGQLPSGNQFISIGNFSSNGTSSVVPGNVPVSTAGFDMSYTIKIINGRGILNVSGLPSGKYTATAYFYGDENHNPAGASSNFTVSKYSTTLNITVDDIRVGEYPVVYIVFSDNITGNVSVSARPVGESSRVSSTAKVENGRANVTIYPVVYMQPSISLGDFIAGDYIIEVEFNGNERYNAVTSSANLTVLKHDLNVSIDYSNDDKTVTVTPDSDITGNVTFTVAESAYDVGPGGMTISLGHLASANYTYTVSYAGDDRYYMYLASDVIPLIRKATVMTVNVTDISYGQTENVEVTLPGDATGDMFFILLDWASDVRVNETLSVVNGKASLQIPNLSAGKYVLNVRYSGSNAYEPAESSANFTVSKLTLNVNVNFNNEAKTITITPSANIASNVTFMLGDIEYGVGPQGRTIDLSSLPSGNHTYTVSYAGDDRYKTYLASDVISVTRKEANVTVAVEDITYGESENVEAVVPEGATGEVVFVLFKNNMTYLSETVIPVNGIASWSMPDLDSGSYTLKATYSGDANYERSSIYEKKFSVAPNIDISPKVKIGDDGKIVIEFGNVGGRIRLDINENPDYRIEQGIIGGKFLCYLPTELLPVGDNNLTFEYIGTALSPNVFKEWDNEKQQYVPIKYLLHIAQRETEGAVDSSNDNVLEIVLEEDNKVLETATGQIEVEIINQFTGEIKKEVINVVNGIGKLDISQYKNGNYIINWKYTGDEKHAPISSQSRLTLTHKASRIAAGDVSMQYTTSKQYSVTVYGTDGKPLKDARITFLIDNKAVASATTNANGVARVSLSSVPGSHKLTVSAPGLAVTKKLTVSHIVTLKTAKIKRSAKKLVLTASLAKVNGKYLKSKSITFKINGKKVGSAKTNAKGVAKLTLKKTFLKKLKAGKKVKYQATYMSDTVVKTTKVKK